MKWFQLAGPLATLLLCAHAPGGDSAPKPSSTETVLTNQEKLWLEAWSKQDVAAAGKLLADDYLEIDAAPPRRVGKAEVLKHLAGLKVAEFLADDVKAVALNPDAAILTYRLTWRGSEQGKDVPTSASYVSAGWARRRGTWVSVFRQVTPIVAASSLAATAGAQFEASFAPQGIRYLYRGTAKLEDITARVQVTMSDGGRVTLHDHFWGTWQPGESKDVSLGGLAFGIEAVQRIDLTLEARADGKKFSQTVASRRQH
jgi:hypothetical protein